MTTSCISYWRRSRFPSSVKGISLFIVPRFLLDEDGSIGGRNDVVPAGVNHKMGFRVNTVLGFGEGRVLRRKRPARWAT